MTWSWGGGNPFRLGYRYYRNRKVLPLPPAKDLRICFAHSAYQVKAAFDAMQELWNEIVPSVQYETVEEMIIFTPEVQGVKQTQATIILFDDAYIAE